MALDGSQRGLRGAAMDPRKWPEARDVQAPACEDGRSPRKTSRTRVNGAHSAGSHAGGVFSLVFDGWRASKAAVTRLGFRHAPPVDHTAGWRESATGYHSNDIESENSRLKGFLRCRYLKLLVTPTPRLSDDGDADDVPEESDLLDVFEYVHYVNIGDSMARVMASVALAGGGEAPRYRCP